MSEESSKAQEPLFEFPILIEESNELVTLFLNAEDAEKARNDEQFLLSLLKKQSDMRSTDLRSKDVEIASPLSDTSNKFIWSDAAVFLLIELYREKEEDFSSGKRSNKIWEEIAISMKETKSEYNVTGLQCSVKMAGLKRTYKNIKDQNNKSGNSKSSWVFFSTMDSLLGDKASIKAPAIATSDGPVPPTQGSSSPTSSSLKHAFSFEFDTRNSVKKRRLEDIIESFMTDTKEEKQEREKENREREMNRERRYNERKEESKRRHDENMKIQESVVAILQKLADKK